MGKGSQKMGYYLHIEPGKPFSWWRNLYARIFGIKAIRKEISAFMMNSKRF